MEAPISSKFSRHYLTKNVSQIFNIFLDIDKKKKLLTPLAIGPILKGLSLTCICISLKRIKCLQRILFYKSYQNVLSFEIIEANRIRACLTLSFLPNGSCYDIFEDRKSLRMKFVTTFVLWWFTKYFCFKVT